MMMMMDYGEEEELSDYAATHATTAFIIVDLSPAPLSCACFIGGRFSARVRAHIYILYACARALFMSFFFAVVIICFSSKMQKAAKQKDIAAFFIPCCYTYMSE